jgi:hypothetical protein
VEKIFAYDSRGTGLFATVLYFAAARCSDWARTHLLHGPGVTRKDVTRLSRIAWQVRYRATKADPTGTSRTVVVWLPRAVGRSFRRRLKATASNAAVFTETSVEMRTYLASCRSRGVFRSRLTGHSFRRGAIRAALMKGASGRAVSHLTGHRSLEMLARYAGIVPREWRRRFDEVGRHLTR